jgi:hypothetical protein
MLLSAILPEICRGILAASATWASFSAPPYTSALRKLDADNLCGYGTDKTVGVLQP